MNKITIGRDANSSIVVPGRYTTVSESHVTIERLGKNYTLIDHSTNGTYVNGVKGMGIDEAISLQQAALDRFMAR